MTKMTKKITSIMAALAVAGLLLALSAAPASAHEERKVGKYTVAVGFGDEPAYVGTKTACRCSSTTPTTSPWSTWATPSRST